MRQIPGELRWFNAGEALSSCMRRADRLQNERDYALNALHLCRDALEVADDNPELLEHQDEDCQLCEALAAANRVLTTGSEGNTP